MGTSRLRIVSPDVASPTSSYQWSTGICLVTSVARRPARASTSSAAGGRAAGSDIGIARRHEELNETREELEIINFELTEANALLAAAGEQAEQGRAEAERLAHTRSGRTESRAIFSR